LQALAAAFPQTSGSQLLRIIMMAVLVGSGLGVYLAALHWLGIVRLAELRAAVLRR
jgi:hypothetical protein